MDLELQFCCLANLMNTVTLTMIFYALYYYFYYYQIEALKEIGVTEVVLAINYQPEVKRLLFSLHWPFYFMLHLSFFLLYIYLVLVFGR